MEPWFSATIPVVAPRVDLALVKNIVAYSQSCKTVSDIASKAFRNHLWYLSEENVAFSFFDKNVEISEKVKMVQNLTRKPKKTDAKRYKLAPKVSLESMKDLTLADFVTERTRNFFSKTAIPTDFLDVHPALWENHEGYKTALKFVESLQVVNDVAERAVAHVKSYNCGLTQSEEEFQKLLLVSILG